MAVLKFGSSGSKRQTLAKTGEILCFWLVWITLAEAFNVDLQNVVQFHGDTRSMFGFSVAEHKENGRSWIVVGAPEMQDPTISRQYKGGALYYCDAQISDSCRMIRQQNFQFHPEHNKFDNNTSQWLGATVRSSGENGVIVACAPRYFWFQQFKNDQTIRDPVGTCFISKSNFTFTEEYSPCRNKRTPGYGLQGSCQVGFAAALSKDSSRLYLGAVGSYFWQGQIISILHTYFRLPYSFDDSAISFDEATGQVFAQNIYSNKSEFLLTNQSPKTEDDSYMGYSIASIDLVSDQTKVSGIVVGVPRGNSLVGKVRLMTWNLNHVKNISGEQFASYFGYAICVTDVDGDGADDIIIGAPMFSNYGSNQIDYERGRVYVYYQNTLSCNMANIPCWDNKFVKYDFLDGEHTKSRFGLSVASLGDINQDGYGDFAVGAPYEGRSSKCEHEESFTGAVYIYHGSKYGVRKKYSQVIKPEEIPNSFGLTTFGFSLSGGLDMDDNTYPDLVVGAYESNTVFLFRSRPVIQLEANMSFLSHSKMIGLNDYNCNLRNNEHAPCVPLQVCLKHDGVGVPNLIDLEIRITLDAKKPQLHRMFFLESEGQNVLTRTIPLIKGGIRCVTLNTYVARLGRDHDKLTSLEAEMKYKLIKSHYSRDGILTPVLNMDDEIPLTRRDSMNIKNNCGQDNICKPNLHMVLSSNISQYVLGAGDLSFNVIVQNFEEDSFGTVFKMQIPPSVSYKKFVDLMPYRPDLSVECFPAQKENNYTINCDIGNPLPSRELVKFNIILEPATTVDEPHFDFWATVISSNPLLSPNMVNPEKLVRISIIEETNLQIITQSTPTIHYNASQYAHEKIESDIQAGPFLRHEYIIKNLGPSEVLEAEVVFDWPSQISTGEDLLYLFAQPLTEGNIRCEPVPNINYRHLQIRRIFNAHYTEYTKPISQYDSTHSYLHTNSKFNQNTGKQSQSGGASVNYINQASNKNPSFSGNNVHQGLDVEYKNQSIHYGSSSVEINQGSNTFYSGNNYSSSNGFHQGNHGRQPSVSQNHWGTGTNLQQGGQVATNNFNQGIYSDSSNSGSFISNNYQGGRTQNGINTVHESESSYSKNTINENGNINTYVEGQWRINNNGTVRQGNFSTISPGYDLSVTNHKDTFFGGGSVPIYTESGNLQHGIGYNTRNKGTVIHQQQIGDDLLTTIDEGVHSGPINTRRRQNETDYVYHYRSENEKFGKPTKLPDNFVTPKSFKPWPNVYGNEETKIPLQDSSQDDEDLKYESKAEDDLTNTHNYDDDVNDNAPKAQRRWKRAALTNGGNSDFCSTSSCTKIACTIGRLGKNEEVSVVFPSIVWVKTIQKIAINRPVEVGSYVEVNIIKLPHIKASPPANFTYNSQILTNVTSIDFSKTPPDVIPLWVVVTSACLGTLILMILVYLLYKSGFFKRNRPPHLPEHQPLNRNGGYHMGDEAL